MIASILLWIGAIFFGLFSLASAMLAEEEASGGWALTALIMLALALAMAAAA